MAENVGGIEYEINADTKGLNQSTNKVDTSTKKMEGSFKRLDTQVARTAKEVKSGFRAMRGATTQLGFQVQDVAVQLQSGTNALIVLGQQGSQVASLFGPGGAILGAFIAVAAAIGSTLLPSLFDAKKSVTELAEATAELVKQADAYTKAQSAAAAIKIQDNLLEAQERLNEQTEERRKLQERLTYTEITYNRVQAGGGKAAGVYAEQIKDLNREITLLDGEIDTTSQSINRMNKALEDIESAGKRAEAGLQGAGTAAMRNSEAIKSLIEALQFQAATLGATDRAIALHTAYLKGATQAEYDRINAIFDSIDAENQRRAQLANQDSNVNMPIEQILGYQQYYQSRIDGEKALADQIKKTAKVSEDAYRAQMSVASSLLTSVQGVTSGIMSSLDEQSTAYKIAFAVQKAAASAQAIVAAESAAAQVLAHDAGILGLGAVATSNLVRGLGYASAGVIAGTAISGGRQYGGPTNAGGIYQTGELNRPEMLTEGGKQYLIPGNRGNVTPLEGSGSSGEMNLSVVVNTLPGQSANVSQSGGGADRQLVINIIEEQALNPGSGMNRNLRKTNTLAPRQGASRRTGS